MPKYWQNLKFSPAMTDTKYKSSYFRPPSRTVKELRKLARSGRKETQRRVIENAGKLKIVWGVLEEAVEHGDVEGRESEEGHTEDAAVLSEVDSLSAAVVQHPAGFELEQDLAAIQPDNPAQEIVLESDDIEAALGDITVCRDEHVGLDVQAATINPDSGKSGRFSETGHDASLEPPAGGLEFSEISASETTSEPSSLSLSQSEKDTKAESLEGTQELGISDTIRSSDAAPELTSEAVLEAASRTSDDTTTGS
jgi:hypothetical protein